MSAPDLATEAGLAGNYPANRFNQRERKLLESVKEYVDNSPPNDVITTEGDLIVGDSGGDAARLAVGAADTLLKSDGTTLSYAKVSLENLDSGITMSHKIIAAGSFTTLGGDATEVITATGATGTDLAFVTVKTAGGTPRSIVAAAAGTNNITVTLSGDPSTDHVLQWQVVRAAS